MNEAGKEKDMLCVFELEQKLRQMISRKDNVFVFYIHHACRERYILPMDQGFANAFSSDVNFLSILSSPPYGLVGQKTMISTAFWKQMRKMSNKLTGEILLPGPELFEWTIGSYLDILKNKKIGEITTHLKFPVILVDLEVEAAIQNGCEYVEDRDLEIFKYTGFMKGGMPHGPGIKFMDNGSVQDGNYENMLAKGLCLYIFPKQAD